LIRFQNQDSKALIPSGCTDYGWGYFYHSSGLKNLISNAKDNVDFMEKSGIYELHCDDCSTMYNGKTGRKFKERMKEHEASFRKENYISLFAKHLVEKNTGAILALRFYILKASDPDLTAWNN
jgi:hypothetical protein